MSLVGCNNVNKEEITDSQNELLVVEKTTDTSDKISNDMQNDGYHFEINSNNFELTVTKNKNSFILTPISDTGNYNFVFKDENGFYSNDDSLANQNVETKKNLISILENYNTNLYTMKSVLVSYQISNRKPLILANYDKIYPIRDKFRQGGYIEKDLKYDNIAPDWSRNVPNDNNDFHTRTFDCLSHVFTDIDENVITNYNWKNNTGSVTRYANYDFNTRKVTSYTTLTAEQEAYFIIQMQYIKQEFDKELANMNITLDELNAYQFK